MPWEEEYGFRGDADFLKRRLLFICFLIFLKFLVFFFFFYGNGFRSCLVVGQLGIYWC